MSSLQPKSENPNGLHQRYIVTKADGSPVDPNAIYFVMRLDSGGKDPTHIEAGRDAACEWADRIQSMGKKSEHLHQTAREIRSMVEKMWFDDQYKQNVEAAT